MQIQELIDSSEYREAFIHFLQVASEETHIPIPLLLRRMIKLKWIDERDILVFIRSNRFHQIDYQFHQFDNQFSNIIKMEIKK